MSGLGKPNILRALTGMVVADEKDEYMELAWANSGSINKKDIFHYDQVTAA